MDGSRGAITTMRSLGCGGPPTTDTEPLRGGGAVARDRAGALVPHPHRYFQVAGRPTLFESLWRGGRVEGDRAWPLDRHSHSDLQVAGGPPPHPERFERGAGEWPAASGRLLARARRIRGGWWSATTHSAFQWGCRGQFWTTRCLVGSRIAFSWLEVVHHCAQCLLRGGGSVRRSSVRAAAPYTHSTHRRRAHRCDASGHYLPRRPPLLYCPGPPPRRAHFARTFPVLGSRRTIRAPAPLCLLLHHLYDPYP